MEEQKKKVNSKKIWLIIILVSVLFIPSFYGFMYLKSYWNNGTAINKVPIAVVDLDQPYTKDGTTYDIGKTIINNLKNNKTLDWQFVNYEEGKSGVYGNKYYAMIVIPKDFSEKVANASTDGFIKPQIDFYQNQGKNYVFSQVSSAGANNIKQSVAQSISKSVSDVLVQTIYKTKDGFKSAADGATQLKSGINQLANGSGSLVTGMDKLQGGATQLSSGVNKLQNGSSQLVDGVNKLQNGSSQLTNGLDKLQNGSSKLTGGINQLHEGSQSLVTGMEKLQGGTASLQSGVNKLQGGASNLSAGIEKLQNGSKGLVAGQAGITEELQELNSLIAKGDTAGAKALAEKISQQSNAIKNGMESLNQGLGSVGSGAQAINAGLGTLGNGVTSLSNGVNEAAAGASKLNNGLGSVSTGMNSLNNGLSSAAVGANALNNGIGSVSTGASALNNGLSTVSGGINSLSNGLDSAKSGASKIDNGLEAANSGVEKLSSGLKGGYNNLNDNVKFSAADMSSFIADPITLNTIVINPVSSYGEGFAPYFMCIGLWVGAMYVYFVTSAMSRRFEGSFQKRFAKTYLIGAGLCVIQALLMSTIVYFGLGLHPKYLGWFYVVNVLTIMAVFSLMNGLHYVITPIMKGALMVIMVLQFTSCGGSYPVAVLPEFYKFVSKFATLTYGVNSMRMAISGIDYNAFYYDILILIVFIVFFVLLGFLVGYFRNHITHKRVLRERSELIDEKETFNQYV